MLNLTFRISHADFLPLANADVVSNGWKYDVIIYVEIYKVNL